MKGKDKNSIVSKTSGSLDDLTFRTGAKKEAIQDCIYCIHYSLHFQNDQDKKRTLINLGSEANAISPAYVKKLSLRMQKTNVGAQKIDGSSLNTFGMVIAGFQIQHKLEKARFFQETFLVADTKIDVVVGMRFFILSNANIRFAEEELTLKTYTAAEALPTTKRV